MKKALILGLLGAVLLLPVASVRAQSNDAAILAQIEQILKMVEALQEKLEALQKESAKSDQKIESLGAQVAEYRTKEDKKAEYAVKLAEIEKEHAAIEKSIATTTDKAKLVKLEERKLVLVDERSLLKIEYGVCIHTHENKYDCGSEVMTFPWRTETPEDNSIIETGNCLIYIVRNGDTYTSVAKLFGVTEEELRKVNKSTARNQLTVGEKVKYCYE